MMRKCLYTSLLIAAVSVLALISSGCNQPGKTAGEIHREHLRKLRIDHQQLVRDVDRTLHFDRPSRLTEMRLP